MFPMHEEVRLFSIGDSSEEDRSHGREAKRTRYGASHPGEQAEDDSSEVMIARGSSGEKRTIRSKFQRRTYIVTSKGAGGRLFGRKASSAGDG